MAKVPSQSGDSSAARKKNGPIEITSPTATASRENCNQKYVLGEETPLGKAFPRGDSTIRQLPLSPVAASSFRRRGAIAPASA
jgi:hypothetical protein